MDYSTVTIPEESLPEMLKVSVDCIAKYGVDVDIMERILRWDFTDNEKVRKYMYCFLKKSGFGDDIGHFNTDKVVGLVGSHKRKDDFKKSIEECNKLQGADKFETAYKTVNCFHDKSPIAFKL